MRVKTTKSLQAFGGSYPTTLAAAKAEVEQLAVSLGATDAVVHAVEANHALAAQVLMARGADIEARTKAFFGGGKKLNATAQWAALRSQWAGWFRDLVQFARTARVVPSGALVSRGLGAFSGFNGILPEIQGVPSGSLEIALGALVGYLLGNSRKQGAVGALIGVAAGAVLGQVSLKSGSTASGGYAVPKQPGVSTAGSAPDKSNSGFDWAAASTIVSGVLSNKQLQAGVDSVTNIIKQAWGSKTAQKYDAGIPDASSYVPWGGDEFYADPCANGGCVKLENSTLEENAQSWGTDETTGYTSTDDADSGSSFW